MSKNSGSFSLFPDLGGEGRLGDVERWAAQRGFGTIIGIDEAGRGPLAGPVVTAAVSLPIDMEIAGLDDSKLLSEDERERLFPEILERASSYGVAFASPELIDRENILNATLSAMEKAALLAESRGSRADLWVIDGNHALKCRRMQKAVVHGDRLCRSVAAASVIAKVLRDRHMILAAKRWPGYGFERHKGYPTAAHRKAVERLGPCPIHRKTFRGVREFISR